MGNNAENKPLVVVYTSKTGFTERYAKMFANLTELPIYTYKEAKKKLAPDTKVIFFGWIMMGGIKDYKTARTKFDICAMCGVGMGETGDQIELIRDANMLAADFPVFTMQGGLQPGRIHGIYRKILKMVRKQVLKTIPGDPMYRTAQQQKVVDMFRCGGDYVHPDNLADVLKWYLAYTGETLDED